jgi:hypothetical protein
MGASALLCGYHIHLSRKIEKHFTELRGKAIPTTLAEATEGYARIKKGDNAAPVYLATFALLTNLTKVDRYLFGKVNDVKLPQISEAKRSEYKSVIAQNEEAYKNIASAVAKSEASYDLKWDAFEMMPMEHLGQTKWLLFLIQLHARLALDENNSSALIRDIEYMLKVSDSLSTEPVMISSLARLDGYRMAYGQMFCNSENSDVRQHPGFGSSHKRFAGGAIFAPNRISSRQIADVNNCALENEANFSTTSCRGNRLTISLRTLVSRRYINQNWGAVGQGRGDVPLQFLPIS